MKGGSLKVLHFKNERGFIFPSVYFLSLLFISLLIWNIHSLKTEIELVELQEEQLRQELKSLSNYLTKPNF
ncbi:hypothetical protein [Salirhabdus sp. Marseille-P4669]|uniref:hypothetical protein n=1 Tax=Salirhabdus sp. Marseille-P4669 TaxID=2042310 RepID=UPI00190E8033|nr:hypothetical protein [Salirhabdus sp. Marseille-P4669]